MDRHWAHMKRECYTYAEIDLAKIKIAKRFLDTVGHHVRPALLTLKVNTAPIKHVHHVQ